MNSYNKQALDILAKEQGFIRDNLEKVMRLVEILNYSHNSNLLSKSLVLKGEQPSILLYFNYLGFLSI